MAQGRRCVGVRGSWCNAALPDWRSTPHMADDVQLPRWLLALSRCARKSAGRAPRAAWIAAVAGGVAVLGTLAWWSLGAALVAACALLVGLGAALFRTARFVDLQRREYRRTSTLDELTALPHRRHFLRVAEREWALAERHNHALALALIDVDDFKRVNETHGQYCGDALLQQIAAAIEAGLRQGDVLARFGGEEFALLLPLTDPLGALDVAERVRERVANLAWNWQGRPVALSVTIGVGARRDEGGSIDLLIADAEVAQRRAKHSGGNCVRGEELASALIPH